MKMNIIDVVIHEIIKDKDGPAKIYLSNEVLDTSDLKIQELVISLDNSFSKKNPKRAKFVQTSNFKAEITNKNKSVLDYSKNLTQNLKDKIEGIRFAKGGYLVFAHFKINDEFLGVFYVRNKEGTKLKQKQVQKSWDLDTVTHLDIEHFAMGAKINFSKLNDQKSNERYISLVRGTTEIAKYFEQWIDIDDQVPTNVNGDSLYKITSHIQPPENITRDELRKAVFKYAKTRPNKIVNLRNLSEFIYSDPNIIPKYAEQGSFDIDGEFKLSGKSLKRFYKVHAKADEIELSAPRSKFSPSGVRSFNSIKIEKNKIIITSPKLADKLKHELDGQD